MESGDLETEWRGRSGEDKWRLNVEINSFVNGTELLRSEKTQSDSKILHSAVPGREKQLEYGQAVDAGRCVRTFPRIPGRMYGCVKCSGESNAPIKAISQHVRWRIGGWRKHKRPRLEKLTAGAPGKSSHLRK